MPCFLRAIRIISLRSSSICPNHHFSSICRLDSDFTSSLAREASSSAEDSSARSEGMPSHLEADGAGDPVTERELHGSWGSRIGAGSGRLGVLAIESPLREFAGPFLAEVASTAAPSQSLFQMAADATDASLSGGELPSMIQTDEPKFRRSGIANSVPKYGGYLASVTRHDLLGLSVA